MHWMIFVARFFAGVFLANGVPHFVSGVQGTMGGSAQPLIHAQLLLRLAGGATPQEAVAAPRKPGSEGE